MENLARTEMTSVCIDCCCLCHYRTGTISPGDYLLAIGDTWLDDFSLEEAAKALVSVDQIVKLRIQKNECYAGFCPISIIEKINCCTVRICTHSVPMHAWLNF
jgi:hypothetical protein